MHRYANSFRNFFNLLIFLIYAHTYTMNMYKGGEDTLRRHLHRHKPTRFIWQTM